MILTKEKTEIQQDKLAKKTSFIGITIPTSGVAQIWKDKHLEYCNYVLYDNSLLSYVHNGKVFGAKPKTEKSHQIYFARKNKFLILADDGTSTFFSKAVPVEDDFSYALLFEMNRKLVLIVADNNFSPTPRCFEFTATSTNLQLCLSTLYGVIVQRNIASANQLKQWLGRYKHPLRLS